MYKERRPADMAVRIFRSTETEIRNQIQALRERYIVLGREAANFDQDGDRNHDVVVYQNQEAMERIQGDIDRLNGLLNGNEYVDPSELTDMTTISVGHEVKLQVRYPDGETEPLLVVLGTETDGLILGKRQDLQVRVLSDISPIGSALKGKRLEEEFTTQAPGGVLKMKVLEFKVSSLLS